MSVNNILLFVLVIPLFLYFPYYLDADVQDRYAEALLMVLMENVCFL